MYIFAGISSLKNFGLALYS